MSTMFARYAYQQAKNGSWDWRGTLLHPGGWFFTTRFRGLCESGFGTEVPDRGRYFARTSVSLCRVGTCGTIAGLIVGARLAGLRTQIVGVRVADLVVANAWAISRMVRRILRLIGAVDAHDINPRRIELWHGDFGKGYAVSNGGRYARRHYDG